MKTYYHITEREDALSILREGFQGGWGDTGFGVYFYGTQASADKYAAEGGWDRRLRDPVALVVSGEDLAQVVPHPDWPAAKYADMFWKEMDEDDEEALWRPAHVEIQELTPPARKARSTLR